ncbi:MAG: sigma 54-dependent Fis family transcriptional regulator [Polyangiaceae bacterium]|nr:sigma 54-dependent Fis family transcriptional regulator [Polyangiaceae bacterium]
MRYPAVRAAGDRPFHEGALDFGEATVSVGSAEPDLPDVWLRIDGPSEVCVPLAAGEELVVGSSPAADVRVHDPTVSARHCRVAHAGSSIDVTDLGSRNGVRLGGVRVDRASLVAGSLFELGRTLVRIEVEARACAEGPPLPQLVGSSRPMRKLAASVRRAAPLRLPVLLRGESGTGKDLVARAIHDESRRSSRPFIVLNAATISRELAESELFGHVRGAFTGAVRDRRGAFREAHQGTLFLDEIAALPLEVQAKLLRVVEEGIVRPLGGEVGQAVDVRLVAATCEPLEEMVAERRFRADLYERLAVCVVPVPPLRERTEDIPELARHLMAVSELGSRDLSAGALAALRAQRWGGNVRELRNVIVQAAVRADGPVLAEHVTAVIAERASGARRKISPGDAVRLFEQEGRNVSAAARRAALPRSTMRDLLKAAGRQAVQLIEGAELSRASA